MSQYSSLIMGWILQESEKTKMSSGNFVGSAIIIGYSKGEWGGRGVYWEGRQVSEKEEKRRNWAAIRLTERKI